MSVSSGIVRLLENELMVLLKPAHFQELKEELDTLYMPKTAIENKYTVSLSCVNFEEQSINYKYIIDIGNDSPAKIIRLSAQNQRYKTTALLIISILLGYYVNTKEDFIIQNLSFEDKKDILDNDRLLQRLYNLKDVIFCTDDDSKISSSEITLKISSEEKELLTISIGNNKINIVDGYRSKEYNLDLNKDNIYEEYSNIMLTEIALFTPHLISKGRNFVKYILVEETKKYWNILKFVEERLKTKQVKWGISATSFSAEVIDSKIRSIEFVMKAQDRFPKYFIHRNHYKRYIQLKDKCSSAGATITEIKELSQKLDTLKEQEYRINNKLNEVLENIKSCINMNFLGDISSQISQLQRLFEESSTADDLNLKVDLIKQEGLYIRPFEISYKLNGYTVNNEINSLMELRKVVQQLNELQYNYFAGLNIFLQYRESINNNMEILLNLREEITHIELLLKKKGNIAHDEQQLRELESMLGQENLSILESIPFHTIELIERNIEIAGIYDINSMEKQLKEYKLLSVETLYDTTRIFRFMEELRNAYEIFGREVSNMSKGINDPNIFSTYSRGNDLLRKLISHFEQEIIYRCPYYFKASEDGVKAFKIDRYDFWQRVFFSEDDILDFQTGLSGGTDSVMTIYSLASSQNGSVFGNILLIDEWGDVSTSFHNAVVRKIVELPSFAFALFVDVNDQYNVINTSIEGE